MKTFKFNTNINCGGCVAKVSPFLNAEFQMGNWEIDFLNPNKILTVRAKDAFAPEIIAVVNQAGFKADLIKEN